MGEDTAFEQYDKGGVEVAATVTRPQQVGDADELGHAVGFVLAQLGLQNADLFGFRGSAELVLQ